MSNHVPTTSYGWIVADLRDIAQDLDRIQISTEEAIPEVEAALAHFHLKKVLESLILAMRIIMIAALTSRLLARECLAC